jgi:hypothetical protein
MLTFYKKSLQVLQYFTSVTCIAQKKSTILLHHIVGQLLVRKLLVSHKKSRQQNILLVSHKNSRSIFYKCYTIFYNGR